MKFTGLHHITMITGDAQLNARYYGDLLGLRLVKKTVNFDQPQAYHLYFGDETGAPGSILTWFEFPRAARGRAGAGAIHTLQLAVADEAALDFWERRLDDTERAPGVLRFADYDGLKLELVVSDLGNAPLRAVHPEIPAEHAISGLHGVRAYASFAGLEDTVLTDLLGFTYEGEGEYLLEGSDRKFRFAYDAPPAWHDDQGAGSVHHIAWASRRRGSPRLAGAHPRRRWVRHRRARPRLLQGDLLPRPDGHPVRDRDALARLRRRRGPGAPRRGAAPARPARAPARPARGDPAPRAQPEGPGMSSLIYRERPAAGTPEGLLVLHHGRGADENDLLGLADVLDPERRLHVVTPGGPLQLPGWPGKHWYVVPRSASPTRRRSAPPTTRSSRFHDETWERTGTTPAQTVFGGFSMGSVMSYSLGLGPDRPAPAGIMAFSGFIPTVEGWTASLADRTDTEVVHRPRPPRSGDGRPVRAHGARPL